MNTAVKEDKKLIELGSKFKITYLRSGKEIIFSGGRAFVEPHEAKELIARDPNGYYHIDVKEVAEHIEKLTSIPNIAKMIDEIMKHHPGKLQVLRTLLNARTTTLNMMLKTNIDTKNLTQAEAAAIYNKELEVYTDISMATGTKQSEDSQKGCKK